MQTSSPSNRAELPGDVVIAVHDDDAPDGLVVSDAPRAEPLAEAAAEPARKKPAAKQPSNVEQPSPDETLFDRLLVEAHHAAATATSIDEYTGIIELCLEAVLEEPDAERRQFALQLASWALNRRGQLKVEEGRDDEALDDFLLAMEHDPQNWRARHNRGISLAQVGRFAEAFDDINLVISIKPRFAKAYCNRATLYVQAGDFGQALEDYERAILLDRTMGQAHIGRGRLCHQEGLLSEGLSHLTAALELGPKSAELYCSRADLLADMGLYSQALADYARAIELDPTFGHAYRNGAWLLATCPNEKFRDPENALRGATQALEMGYGEKCILLDTIAAALASAGYYEEAQQALDQAIALAPESLRGQYVERRDLYATGRPFLTQPLSEVVQAGYVEE